MDPLSVTASVIAIAGAVTAVYKEITTFIADVKGAPKEVEAIRANVVNIYTVTSNLRDALEEREIRIVVEDDALARKHVKDLQSILVDTKAILDAVAVKLHQHFRSTDRGKEYKFRVQWWKAKEDFQRLLGTLQQNKETLSMSMVGLNTLQTLRILGRGGHSSQSSEPAATLRSYAESILEGTTASGSLTQAPVFENLPTRGDSVRVLDRAEGPAIPLTLEAKRELVMQKLQIQSDLLNAAKSGSEMEAEILLGEGAEVDWKDPSEGKTALHLAAQYGHPRIIQVLLDCGADIEAKCEPFGSAADVKFRAGRTPLIWAAAGVDAGGRHDATVRLLLDSGADVMSRNYFYRTALHEAVLFTGFGGDAERVIQMLLDHGALVNAYDNEGWTPLHECGARGHYDIALKLLHHGASIEGRPSIPDPACFSNPVLINPRKSSHTPLLLAATGLFQSRKHLIRLFLAHKANVYARLDSGETLLHLCASHGNIAFAMMLIDAGCDVNVKDTSNDDTPLHKAASAGQLTIIRALLAKGAIVRGYKNTAGRDALQEAREFGQVEALGILSKYTPNISETNDSTSDAKAFRDTSVPVSRMTKDAGGNLYQYPTEADSTHLMPQNLESTALSKKDHDQGHPNFKKQFLVSPAANEDVRYRSNHSDNIANRHSSAPDHKIQAPSSPGYLDQEDNRFAKTNIEALNDGQRQVSNEMNHGPGDSSPPHSIARSSYGTTISISEGQRRRTIIMEERLSQHYAVLKRFLAQSLRGGKGNPRLNRARDKLLRLSPFQFQDLSTDVYDELLRRQSSVGQQANEPGQVPPYLPPKEMFHLKRNQVRQKLGTLPPQVFHDLVTDSFNELERRFPLFAGNSGSPFSSPAMSTSDPPSRVGSPLYEIALNHQD